eukprot:7753808-Pyramimonas_sp.AAC.1
MARTFRQAAAACERGCRRLLSLLAVARTYCAPTDRELVTAVAARLEPALAKGRAGLLSVFSDVESAGGKALAAAVLGGKRPVGKPADAAVTRAVDQALDLWRAARLLRAEWVYAPLLAGVQASGAGEKERSWQGAVLIAYQRLAQGAPGGRDRLAANQPLLHAHHKLALLELLVQVPPALTKSSDAFHGRPPIPSPAHCIELLEEAAIAALMARTRGNGLLLPS